MSMPSAANRQGIVGEFHIICRVVTLSLQLYKIADKTLLSNANTIGSHSVANAVIKHHKIEAVNGDVSQTE